MEWDWKRAIKGARAAVALKTSMEWNSVSLFNYCFSFG